MNNRSFFESRTGLWILIAIAGILAAVCILGVFANKYKNGNVMSYTNANPELIQNYKSGKSESNSGYGTDSALTGEAGEERGYKYEVIAENGSINVYSLDPYGEKAFFCETDILFSLLSENDKKLMTEGIVVNTMEELNNLLQDYES